MFCQPQKPVSNEPGKNGSCYGHYHYPYQPETQVWKLLLKLTPAENEVNWIVVETDIIQKYI